MTTVHNMLGVLQVSECNYTYIPILLNILKQLELLTAYGKSNS